MTEPLVCPAASFVTDPVLADTVQAGFDIAAIHSPTGGPNRLTDHVPTETTRLSLGERSATWNTDVGIVGYTDSHVHFETKANDRTVVSLGGPASTSGTAGYGGAGTGPTCPPDPNVPMPPLNTHGYSMVTEVNAWHDTKEQHYFLSQTGDMSLRAIGAGKRAVIQADEGAVNVMGGIGVNVSGGGVSIGAAEELELEDVRYAGEWAGHRPHSTAAKAGNIGAAVAAAAVAVHDVVVAKARTRYKSGEFAAAEQSFLDKHKRATAGVSLVFAAKKVFDLCRAEEAPPKCIKIDAEEKVGMVSGNDLGMFGLISASLGSAGWTTVSSLLSTGLKAMGLAGVGGGFVAVKGFRKAEIGSDYGDTFVGAKKEIHVSGEKELKISAKGVTHLAAPDGLLLLGAKQKLFLGTTAGGGWGLMMEPGGLSLGSADGADKLSSAKVKADGPAIHIKEKSIELKASSDAEIKLADSKCTVKTKEVRMDAAKGSFTINGAKILFK